MSVATECGGCGQEIHQDSGPWVHELTGLIRCHAFDAMRGSAKPRGEYSAAGLAILDELRRPRPGDLEAATQPHTFRTSGEYIGLTERCDLCGCLQRGTWLHPEQTLPTA